MVVLFYAIITSTSLLCTTCAHVPTTLSKESEASYKKLSYYDRKRVHRILSKINEKPKKERDYYYNKLNRLLAVPKAKPNSKETKKLASEHKEELDKASQRAEETTSAMDEEERAIFTQAEEEYETYGEPQWERYKPSENDDGVILVDRRDVADILVKVWIQVEGDKEIVDKIVALEDAIEKHLSIAGFSINIIFVDKETPDAFVVGCDQEKWITSHNWGGGPNTMAHELMHLLGLPDEYDGMRHAENKHLSMRDRLWYFEKALDSPFLPDAQYGIMSNQNNPPLHRHICAAVGLEVEPCVKKRMEYLESF
jgi:hypothetical protein